VDVSCAAWVAARAGVRFCCPEAVWGEAGGRVAAGQAVGGGWDFWLFSSLTPSTRSAASSSELEEDDDDEDEEPGLVLLLIHPLLSHAISVKNNSD